MTDCTIITGGGRGIGRAIALRMAEDMNTILVGRTYSDLYETCLAIEQTGRYRALPLPGDVTGPLTARDAVRLVRAHAKQIRNLICNAGIGKGGPFESFAFEAWRHIFDVNVDGAFHFAQACIPEMIKAGGGTVIILASTAGLEGFPYQTAYTSSKHALVGMAKSLAKEYDKRGIRVIPVCPGFVESEMTERTIHGVMERKRIDYGAARARLGPILTAESVAEAIADVCSGKLCVVNGEPLVLEG